ATARRGALQRRSLAGKAVNGEGDLTESLRLRAPEGTRIGPRSRLGPAGVPESRRFCELAHTQYQGRSEKIAKVHARGRPEGASHDAKSEGNHGIPGRNQS